GARQQGAQEKACGQTDKSDDHRIFGHIALNAAAGIAESARRTAAHVMRTTALPLVGIGRPMGCALIGVTSPFGSTLIGFFRLLTHLVRSLLSLVGHRTALPLSALLRRL